MRTCSWLPSNTAYLQLLVSFLISNMLCYESAEAEVTDVQPILGTSAIVNPLNNGALLIQADNVIYDSEKETVRATGNVEITYEDRTLTADEVIYYQKTDRVVAQGNVNMLEPTGEVFFGKKAELSDQLRKGVIEGFSALLDQNARVASDKAYRSEEGSRHELTHTVYTACDVCNSDGDTKTPLWRIKSFRVIHDKEDREIIMRDAYFELFGTPILYLPYISHPDPTVKRKTGFLSPSIGNNNLLGTFFDTPYFINIAPHYDLTLSPFISLREGYVLKGNWRQRLRKGSYMFNGSVGYVEQKNILRTETGKKTFRGHIFGNGRFRLSDVWSTGFDLQWVSNDTYLQRFNIFNDQDLETRIYLLGVDGRNYANINAYYFQGLRSFDRAGLTPFIFPLINAHYVFEPGNFGRINFDVNAMILQRTSGGDSRRMSLATDWQRAFTTQNGQVITPFAHLRSDLYITSDRNPNNLVGLPDNSEVILRGLPTAGIDWRWPFARNGNKVQLVVEPIIQAIFSSTGGSSENIPNEDSQSFGFDTTNLFSINRFPGFDRWENGQRFNFGVRFTAQRKSGGSASLIFGRSYRIQENTPFVMQSGLGTKGSDYVGSIKINPNRNVSITHRFRLDGQDFSIRRNEVRGSINFGRVKLNGEYLKTDSLGMGTGIGVREEASLSGQLKVTNNWKLSGGTRRDLIIGEGRTTSASITYQNECGAFTISWVRRNTTNRDITPGNSILFTFSLKTLTDATTLGGY